jgi:hypothetical protein
MIAMCVGIFIGERCKNNPICRLRKFFVGFLPDCQIVEETFEFIPAFFVTID